MPSNILDSDGIHKTNVSELKVEVPDLSNKSTEQTNLSDLFKEFYGVLPNEVLPPLTAKNNSSIR